MDLNKGLERNKASFGPLKQVKAIATGLHPSVSTRRTNEILHFKKNTGVHAPLKGNSTNSSTVGFCLSQSVHWFKSYQDLERGRDMAIP